MENKSFHVVKQVRAVPDLYKLKNDMRITKEELNKLIMLMPETNWIIVNYKSTPPKEGVRRITFDFGNGK